MGQNQKWIRRKLRKSDRTRQKNKRGDIEKWYQTDNPEIPDRGEDIRNYLASLRGLGKLNRDGRNQVVRKPCQQAQHAKQYSDQIQAYRMKKPLIAMGSQQEGDFIFAFAVPRTKKQKNTLMRPTVHFGYYTPRKAATPQKH